MGTKELLAEAQAFLNKRCGARGKDEERRSRRMALSITGKFPALKVHDPEFVVGRLRAGESAGFFSKKQLISKIGEPQALVGDGDIPMVYAIVRQYAPVSTVDVEKFAAHVVDGVDSITRAEFDGVDSFYYIPLELVEDLSDPVILKSQSAIINFETDIAKGMVDPRAFAADPKIVELGSMPAAELMLLRGSLIDLLSPSPVDESLIPAIQAAHCLVVAELQDRGVMAEKVDAKKAVWSTAFINTLPDSSFLYIEPGKSKDSDGKTVPRTARHFPVKDANGKVDLPHLRNAIARIPQSNAPGLTPDKKKSLQDKARRMLDGANKVDVGKCDDRERRVRIVKSEDQVMAEAPEEERFIFGVVLVPDEPDSQDEIYSAEEVRKAAHAYMERANGVFKVMHNGRPVEGVKILETYLTKTAETHGGETFPLGTWLMGARVTDDELWDDVRKGVFTGFSIGGTAIREALQ